MKIFCDDGSTNVKLAWFEGKTLKSAVSVNSFRHNWKVEGLGSSRTYNYLLDGRKYTYDPVSEAAISTTHIEYQYSDTNVLAVHHALLNSGIEPQEIDLTVTLPISEFYTADCQKNTLNNVGQYEKSLVIDLGGTTLDVGVIVGQFEDVSAVHGNPDIGVSMVTKATLTALKMASSDTSPMIADELIKNRENLDFVGQVVNEAAKQNLVLDTIDTAIHKLGELVVDDLLQYRNVNRVYIVGGGAALIADAVRKAWNHLGEKVVLMDEPQTALVLAIARFKAEE